VQESLSWFLDNYGDFATWRATADRLTTFEETLVRESQRHATVVETGGDSLEADDLAVSLPSGAPLLEHVSLRAQPGDAVLLQGPSGSGKSTLLRSLSGIWPYARGRVHLPADTMCIPQNPYFPEGSLRAALAYPEPQERYGDEQLKQALNDALLPQLASRLDEHNAWSLKLSGGERQRLAVARVLLKQPRWVLADEATSALDPDTARGVYQSLLASVRKAGGAIVSIAHGDALEPFHNRSWRLRKQEAGAPYRVVESAPSR
jgi:vitamin B12/bleomycin/antimicrobial peptide transport system ATP-binding/permease protein